MTTPDPLHRQLAALRARAGLSQRDLAARMGGAQSTVCALEVGRVSPTLTTLTRWAAALGAEIVLRVPGEEVSALAADAHDDLDDIGVRAACADSAARCLADGADTLAWRQIGDSLADVQPLVARVRTLKASLAAVRKLVDAAERSFGWPDLRVEAFRVALGDLPISLPKVSTSRRLSNE